jgi:L,D-peptidoglycan transpeptidase YkuD (ErfK/YbiS/YcfS/YnhG family)
VATDSRTAAFFRASGQVGRLSPLTSVPTVATSRRVPNLRLTGRLGRMARLLALAVALVAVSACGVEPAQVAETAPPAQEPVAPLSPTPLPPTPLPPTAAANTTTTTPTPPAPVAQAEAPDRPPAVAIVSEPADRGAPYDPDAGCDLVTVAALAARHPDVRQFVVAATDSFADTWGTVELAVWADGEWRCQTEPQEARFGRTGTRPLLDRRSGDGTTPAGVFPLGTVTAWDGEVFQMFGNSPDPGVLADYREVRPEDCWGATANTDRYQHLVNHPDCPGPDDEDLERIAGVYEHAAVIGANLDPISGDEPGETPYAAAIFLHRHNYGNGATSGSVRATSGCVSLEHQDLVDALRLIDPARAPHFAIGPVEWLRTTA